MLLPLTRGASQDLHASQNTMYNFDFVHHPNSHPEFLRGILPPLARWEILE